MDKLSFSDDTWLKLFAMNAPSPTDNEISLQMKFDINKNPHNDDYKPKRRTADEIIAEYKFKYARAMLTESQKKN